MRPDQLDLLATPGVPAVSPAGDSAVVSVLRPDAGPDAYTGQLWTVPLSGGEPVRLTRGFRDTAPRFSPDGRLLAFLRAAPPGAPGNTSRAQLHVVAAGGGEPVRLTDAPLGAGVPHWSPDGTRIVFLARDPEPGRYGTVEGVGPDAEPPRLITDLRYLADGVGHIGDRPLQVFAVPVPDPSGAPQADPAAPPPAATRLTSGPPDVVSVAWSPDGTRLALVSARHDTRATDLRSDVWTCAADGSGLTRVTRTTLAPSQVAWSPDGAVLWFLASDPGPTGLDFVARLDGLWSVPADGSADPVRHTDPATVDLGEVGASLTVTDTGVLVLSRTRGRVELLEVPAAGAEPRVVLGGDRWVTGVDAVAGPDGPVVVAAVSTPDSPGELVHVAPGPERTLTRFSAALQDGPGVRPLHEVSVPADDGYPVHGWVVLPDGPGPHPVLLDVHGGPFTQFGWHVYDEAQVLAAAGYAVVLLNPRGSAGYGEAHGRAIVGAMGDRDAADLLDALDGLLADPAAHLGPDVALDGSRVGVLGGSYGGYMTAWLTTHLRCAGRFAAAVVERGFLDPDTFVGTSDIGWFFSEAYLGTEPERVRAQSPMAAVGRVSTPTLVIHSEEDLRCPLEQGQRWFAALHRAGVPTQFLLFPGESHGLTREGRPSHRRIRFEHLLRWWAQHLPTAANPS